MDYATASTHATYTPTGHYNLARIHELMDECEQIYAQHRADNPDIYRLVELQKQQEKDGESLAVSSKNKPQKSKVTAETLTESIFATGLKGAQLRRRIQTSYREIRQRTEAFKADIIPRTQAHNRKCAYQSLEEERGSRADVVAAQIRAWRSIMPNLIRRFRRIPDYRRPGSIQHKMTVLMVFGLFAFIFRLSSRREMNRELTSPVIFNHLKKIFPEIDSIPHADTLARALEQINPKNIESIHVSMIKGLIKKKKFRNFLIQNCLPIAIDGSQKLYRQGLWHDESWCERKVGNADSDDKQQYLYILEANITLSSGLTLPLMTEYLYRSHHTLEQDQNKQDSETTAFERLVERLKEYFPRLKIMVLMDAMFATQSVMGILHTNKWEYMICLPKRKLTDFAKILNRNRKTRIPLPNRQYYRKRKQSFFWENNIPYGYDWELNISLVACFEEYEEVNHKTGKIEKCYSEHAWISSIPVNVDNLHELLNLGARKKELIEDSFNTEKNRGYHYKHSFSYQWNAMQGFHYLMRLAHAINAISEFTKILKKSVKDLGCSATLKLIKETLFSPWLSLEWYGEQTLKTPQLRLQLE